MIAVFRLLAQALGFGAELKSKDVEADGSLLKKIEPADLVKASHHSHWPHTLTGLKGVCHTPTIIT